MRHSYFQEAREADAKKVLLEQSADVPPSLEIVVPKKTSTLSKTQAPKALPSLVSHEGHDSSGTHANHHHKQIETSPIVPKQPPHQQKHPHHVLPSSSTHVASNSLPPIAIIAANTTGALKHLKGDSGSVPNTTRSNRSLQQQATQPQPTVVLKKKKRNEKVSTLVCDLRPLPFHPSFLTSGNSATPLPLPGSPSTESEEEWRANVEDLWLGGDFRIHG
jgi:hypothetical protein